MPQTQYNLTPNPAQPGMPLSNDRAAMKVRCLPAAVVIPFGVMCEAVVQNGQAVARPIQDSTTGATFTTNVPPTMVGVSLLDTFAAEMGYLPYSVPPNTTGSSVAGYPVGFSVPFVFSGGIWMSWDGNTGVALPLFGNIQLWHSSTGANPQGVATTKAAQTTAGAEIDGPFSFLQVADISGYSGAYTDSFGNVIDIVAVQVNLPGKA